MTGSPLENETTSDTATFDHFGRTWTIPTKRHLSHVKFMRDEMARGVGSADLMIAEAFLSPEVSKQNQQKPDQFSDLLDIDPDEDALDEFTTCLMKAMGFGGSGNSSPSSTSS